MSQRNPFDDVETPKGVPPQSFRKAQAEVDKTINEAVVRIHEAPPQVLPDLITGEDYHRLKPESIEQVQQDLLDDKRFATINDLYSSDTNEMGAVDLPNHQERLRAARAMCRRDWGPGHETAAEICAERLTRLAAWRKLKTRVSIAIWSWSIFCFVFSTISTGNPIVGLGIGAFMFYGIVAVLRVMSSVARMGESSGNAV